SWSRHSRGFSPLSSWGGTTPGRSEYDLIRCSADDDLPTLLQRADRLDDRGLRLLDVAQAHRAEELHLFLERRGRALGHHGPDSRLHLVARGLERERELARVDRLEHPLQRPVVEAHDVLEDEHEALDLLAELGILTR